MKFWVYLKKELSDLQPDFEKIFGVNNLYRDYENVWEWLESVDRQSDLYVNISRPHNWSKGEYDTPIKMIVESNNGVELNEAEFARRIKKQLKCDVYAGEILDDQQHDKSIRYERKY